jgi:hypothetical protein
MFRSSEQVLASWVKAFERKKLTKVFQVPKKEWGYDSDGMYRLIVLVEPERERERECC